MGFHAEIPRVAFLGLAHLGVSFLFGILCGGGRSNDGGIHDGAFSHEQFALLLSSRPTSSKSCLVKSCSSSRWRKWSSVVASGTDSTLRSIPVKVRIAWTLVDRVFERFVRQPIPLLEKVDAQHALDTDRRTRPPGLRIVRFDHPPSSLSHGTTASISARKRSRRVTFFFPSYSLCAKLICFSMPPLYPRRLIPTT